MIECMFTFVKCSALFLFIFIFPFHLYEPRSQKNVAQAIPRPHLRRCGTSLRQITHFGKCNIFVTVRGHQIQPNSAPFFYPKIFPASKAKIISSIACALQSRYFKLYNNTPRKLSNTFLCSSIIGLLTLSAIR